MFVTRSRPDKKNDQATIKSKNSHLVRKNGLYYRYDTDAELRVLNRLWRLAGDRFNYLTPTRKPSGFACDVNAKRKRLYDAPKPPLDRWIAAHVLAPEPEAELLANRDSLNPEAIGRRSSWLPSQLLAPGMQSGPDGTCIRPQCGLEQRWSTWPLGCARAILRRYALPPGAPRRAKPAADDHRGWIEHVNGCGECHPDSMHRRGQNPLRLGIPCLSEGHQFLGAKDFAARGREVSTAHARTGREILEGRDAAHIIGLSHDHLPECDGLATSTTPRLAIQHKT